MTEVLEPRTKELAAIAAAVAGHCQPCFTFHHGQAVAVGVSPEAIQAVVALARTIRAAGDRHMDERVMEILTKSPPTTP